jgi:hypothetical protein
MLAPPALPSVAPVSMNIALTDREVRSAPRYERGGRGERTVHVARPKRGRAIFGMVSMVLVAMLFVAVIGVAELMPATFARGRAEAVLAINAVRQKATPSEHTSVAAPPPALVGPLSPLPPQVGRPSAGPPVAPTSMSVPPVSLESEPIDAEHTLVTLPASAKGHRVYVDGQPLSPADAGADDRALFKCGTHTIKIGSAGVGRSMELPCGAMLTID